MVLISQLRSHCREATPPRSLARYVAQLRQSTRTPDHPLTSLQFTREPVGIDSLPTEIRQQIFMDVLYETGDLCSGLNGSENVKCKYHDSYPEDPARRISYTCTTTWDRRGTRAVKLMGVCRQWRSELASRFWHLARVFEKRFVAEFDAAKRLVEDELERVENVLRSEAPQDDKLVVPTIVYVRSQKFREHSAHRIWQLRCEQDLWRCLYLCVTFIRPSPSGRGERRHDPRFPDQIEILRNELRERAWDNWHNSLFHLPRHAGFEEILDCLWTYHNVLIYYVLESCRVVTGRSREAMGLYLEGLYDRGSEKLREMSIVYGSQVVQELWEKANGN